jgi:hypothetical protein
LAGGANPSQVVAFGVAEASSTEVVFRVANRAVGVGLAVRRLGALHAAALISAAWKVRVLDGAAVVCRVALRALMGVGIADGRGSGAVVGFDETGDTMAKTGLLVVFDAPGSLFVGSVALGVGGAADTGV